MSYAPQSSPGLRLLPACLLLAALAVGPVAAQDQRHLDDSTDLHRDPAGAPLVSLPAGAAIETGAVKGEWREAAVEGWIFSPSTSPTKRDGYDLVVTSDEGENLRRKPNGVGRLETGRQEPDEPRRQRHHQRQTQHAVTRVEKRQHQRQIVAATRKRDA